MPSENIILGTHLFWVLQCSKEGKLLLLILHLFLQSNLWGSSCQMASGGNEAWENTPLIQLTWVRAQQGCLCSNSHCCALHPTRVADVLGFGRKSFLEQRSSTVLVFCMTGEFLRMLPHYLMCGILPACNPIPVASCLVPLPLCTWAAPWAPPCWDTFVSWCWQQGRGVTLFVTNSCDLQEHLYFMSLWGGAILLKHSDLPGLGSLVQQGFSKARSLLLTLCTKGDSRHMQP